MDGNIAHICCGSAMATLEDLEMVWSSKDGKFRLLRCIGNDWAVLVDEHELIMPPNSYRTLSDYVAAEFRTLRAR
jgi:hypothetical protein